MNRLLWVLQILLALAFLTAGSMKLLTPKAELDANPMMGWSKDFSAMQVKSIGLAEVAGAIGLIVPAASGIMPVLTPAAGAALALLMAGAVATHLRRGEPVQVPLILCVLAAAVAAARFRGGARR